MCLDVNPNNRQPFLAPCGNFTGQLWFVGPTNRRVADQTPTYRDDYELPERERQSGGDIGNVGSFPAGMGGEASCEQIYKCPEGYRMSVVNHACACEQAMLGEDEQTK
jgi:hypothetical protein